MTKRILSTIFLLAVTLATAISPFGQAIIVTRNTAPQIIQANLVADYRFTEGSGSWIYNRVSTPTASVNILGAFSEQLNQHVDSSVILWSSVSTTITDFYNGTTDPNGNNSASRLQMTATGISKGISLTTTLAATPYTLSVYAKSNTGVSQAIRMGNTASPSTDKTVTTSWTRFTETFTPGAGSVLVGLLNDTAFDAVDISVYGFQLELGGSASAYVLPIGNLQLGKILSPATNLPTWTSTGQSYGASVYAHGTTTAPFTFAHITAYAVIKKAPSTDSTGVGEPILTSGSNTTPPYGVLLESRDYLNSGVAASSTGPCFGVGFTPNVVNAPGVKVDDGKWHVLAGTYDGANIKIYWDGTQVTQKAAVITAQTVNRLFTGMYESTASSSNYFPGSIGMLSLYTEAHTTAQIRQNTIAMFGNMALRSVVMGQATKFIGVEGDSIPGGTGVLQTQRWPYLMLQNISPVVNHWNDAVGGSTVADITSRIAVFNQALNPNTTRNVLVVEVGANDLVSGSSVPATYVAALKAYCITQRANGWNKIVIVPILPNLLFPGLNSRRNIANGLIAADPSFYDAFATLDPTMMADSAPSDPTLYQADLTHPTPLGHSLIEVGIETAVTSVLP